MFNTLNSSIKIISNHRTLPISKALNSFSHSHSSSGDSDQHADSQSAISDAMEWRMVASSTIGSFGGSGSWVAYFRCFLRKVEGGGKLSGSGRRLLREVGSWLDSK